MNNLSKILIASVLGAVFYNSAATANIVEIEIYQDGIEYECLQDTQTGKIFNCERD
ncbi:MULTISPECIES: hypothetical protein [unclassified Agarivorans]|uniref:hypothetical protein n=1 Tax=unclassified Agarivorans TaxID=2636026 RepID=UPI0010F0072D|nr:MULTISPECIES: hypothetical protein [unclassified Agarivorans]MDO6685014.1 hypothetical protein [Agarivorans sp. 3_MG-2023]MDO6717428.1 hypothetical protein [Agarivorans sp. 2_MG-2023]MDO6765337.1 hypothetical protein [Agarivorans sp. 1_MG-2023]GDY28173.1 hypothetical protein AHAT_40630 [Agarivorans sp. Toyoura001]